MATSTSQWEWVVPWTIVDIQYQGTTSKIPSCAVPYMNPSGRTSGKVMMLVCLWRPSLKPYNQNRLHGNEIISNSDSNSVWKPASAFGPPLKHQWKIPKSMGSRWLNPLTTDVISPHPLSSVRLSNLRLPSILRRLLMPGCEQILQHHMIRIDSYIGAGCDTLKDYYSCSSCFKIARNCDKYQQHSI